MKKPVWNKKDDRRSRAAEFWRALTPAALEAYLESAPAVVFTGAVDALECFCGRLARHMAMPWVRFTYSASAIFCTDERHGAHIFYVETPLFMRAFAFQVGSRPAATGRDLLPELRVSQGLPAVRREVA